jgi:phosphatidylglycerol:prolipoprotein diacylglycerol transferase
MHPILWQSASCVLYAYPFFLVMAALTLVGVAVILAQGTGINSKKSLPILLLMGLAVLVGARLLNVLIRPEIYAADPTLIYSFKSYGFSLYGGLLLAAITGGAACLATGVSIPRLADATAPALGLAIAVLRIGCFMAGCCFGRVTDQPWGVSFPMFSLAHWAQIQAGQAGIFQTSLPVHPTQLYELLAALGCGGVAYLILKRKAAPGTAFAVFFLLFSIFRYINRYFRYEIHSALPDYFYPILYGFICISAIGYIIYMNFVRPKANKSPMN